MYRPLKILFLETLKGKKWKKNLKWSHVKKKKKKEGKIYFSILLTLYKIFVLLSICSVGILVFLNSAEF